MSDSLFHEVAFNVRMGGLRSAWESHQLSPGARFHTINPQSSSDYTERRWT